MVEWEFLERIMVRLGFPVQWMNLAMMTIHTALYSILINGEPHGCITPFRGIKQSDPLSPYLFILCTADLVIYLEGTSFTIETKMASASTSKKKKKGRWGKGIFVLLFFFFVLFSYLLWFLSFQCLCLTMTTDFFFFFDKHNEYW